MSGRETSSQGGNIDIFLASGGVKLSERKSGFYWVQVPVCYDGDSIHWEIAFFDNSSNRFELCGNEVSFDENFFIKVGELVKVPYPLIPDNP
jgi:hypothetical protein